MSPSPFVRLSVIQEFETKFRGGTGPFISFHQSGNYLSKFILVVCDWANQYDLTLKISKKKFPIGYKYVLRDSHIFIHKVRSKKEPVLRARNVKRGAIIMNIWRQLAIVDRPNLFLCRLILAALMALSCLVSET